MVSLNFKERIVKIVLEVIDNTIGKKFPIIDKATDLFQAHDNKIKRLEEDIDKIKKQLQDIK
tara:strand:- start:967 stop:1152 length:186 start_codon:yes stop_codon:yes gene_type:complete